MPPASRSPLKLTNVHKGVTFYDKSDEKIFMEWWSRIPCVEGVYAEGNADGLFVRLRRRPGKRDLRQILALCRRYGVDMRQLATLKQQKIAVGSAIRRCFGITRYSANGSDRRSHRHTG
jgi:hypothetical protein